ncbi:superoxide dismutase family protein [Neotamlana laminarinivorans]|uniref:Superoxide dismutase [Cu-Zn] n=1 Tax=Neotamlana laminarinivorans TaxID=2883124 RepID=A0A9X1L3X3_9FLAO|nr:superoxide dismutase family protein [Tamlana laminarinivorans]MCB4798687.1 superoxide dismutase family protein [Tamlana laminarinivorans]
MKNLNLLLIVSTIATFTACKNNTKQQEEKLPNHEVSKTVEEKTNNAKSVTIALNAKSESNVGGKVVFTENNDVVNMVASINGLEPGVHAIHIHETADCSSADGKSAGGHWNPTSQPHGAWGAETGYHKGDIGNFTADESGHAEIEFSTSEWCLDCNDSTKNIIGKGLIVHAGKDDLTSQPSGDAGARVSCAGIIQ